jgi:hypothetical protein
MSEKQQINLGFTITEDWPDDYVQAAWFDLRRMAGEELINKLPRHGFVTVALRERTQQIFDFRGRRQEACLLSIEITPSLTQVVRFAEYQRPTQILFASAVAELWHRVVEEWCKLLRMQAERRS